jgi:hypothetical protein
MEFVSISGGFAPDGLDPADDVGRCEPKHAPVILVTFVQKGRFILTK